MEGLEGQDLLHFPERFRVVVLLIQNPSTQIPSGDAVGVEHERLVAVPKRILPLPAGVVVCADALGTNLLHVPVELVEDVLSRNLVVLLSHRDVGNRELLARGDIPEDHILQRPGLVGQLVVLGTQSDLRLDLRSELSRQDTVQVLDLSIKALGLILDFLFFDRHVRRKRVDELAQLFRRVLAEVIIRIPQRHEVGDEDAKAALRLRMKGHRAHDQGHEDKAE
ncbi:MAG: hypothetical protein COA88_01500 [Kordia sp.]|nr:MAG: hypothetical protein COA88_01500 [Kordia sp.]